MDLLEGARLQILLNANRCSQKNIKKKIALFDKYLLYIETQRKEMQAAIKITSDDPATRAVKTFVAKRTSPRLYFPPFFKSSINLVSTSAKHRLIREYLIASKPVVFHRAEIISLKTIIFTHLLAEQPEIKKQVQNLFYDGSEDIIFRDQVFEFIIRTYGDIPSTWGDFMWKLIASSFPHRSSVECRLRYLHYDSPSLNTKDPNKHEIALLKAIAEKHNYHNWKLIANEFDPKRSPAQVFRIYKKHIWSAPLYVWTPDQDSLLIKLVKDLGRAWAEISIHFGCSNNQALTEFNNVDPSMNRGFWSPEEDMSLKWAVEMFKRSHPNQTTMKWVLIALFVNTRTGNQCKSRYEIMNATKGKIDMKTMKKINKLVSHFELTGELEGLSAEQVYQMTRVKKVSIKRKIPWKLISKKFFPNISANVIRNAYLKSLRPRNRGKLNKLRKDDVDESDDENCE